MFLEIKRPKSDAQWNKQTLVWLVYWKGIQLYVLNTQTHYICIYIYIYIYTCRISLTFLHGSHPITHLKRKHAFSDVVLFGHKTMHLMTLMKSRSCESGATDWGILAFVSCMCMYGSMRNHEKYMYAYNAQYAICCSWHMCFNNFSPHQFFLFHGIWMHQLEGPPGVLRK